MALIELQNVTKRYRLRKFGRRQDVVALGGVSLQLQPGTCLGLVGESGCGKSTLGRLLVGLEEPTSGKIIFSERVSGNGRQMVFQDSFDAVNPLYTAAEIIAEPLRNFFVLARLAEEERIVALLEKVGLSAEDREKYPHQFSGGQLQRICIARALAAESDLLVLDEPLSSLDVSVQAQILNLLADLKAARKLTFLLISHDLEAVYYLSDAVAVMYGGKIMEVIDCMTDFDKLVHPYSKKLLASSPSHFNKAADPEIEVVAGNLLPTTEGCPYAARCRKAAEICQGNCPTLTMLAPGHRVACHFL